MAGTVSKRSRKLLAIFAMIGLSGLILLIWIFQRRNPQTVIAKVLSRYGINAKTIKYWIAVSAFETKGWTSKVYKDSKNLFTIIGPGDEHLDYGEGQSIYSSISDSVVALYKRVMVPFKYPLSYESIDDLVDTMKSKGYFTGDANNYKTGVKYWYQKIYG